jgi:hypothetical protein
MEIQVDLGRLVRRKCEISIANMVKIREVGFSTTTQRRTIECIMGSRVLDRIPSYSILRLWIWRVIGIWEMRGGFRVVEWNFGIN